MSDVTLDYDNKVIISVHHSGRMIKVFKNRKLKKKYNVII